MRLLFYRPQSAGELLDVSFNVVKRHPVLLIRLGIWPTMGIAAIDLCLGALPADSGLLLLALPLTFAVYSLGEAGVSFAAWRLLHGETVEPAAVWSRVREHLPSVVVGYLIKWLVVMCGLLLLILPGALLLLRWFAVPAATVIEGHGVRQSFARSRQLARGNRRQIFITVGLLDVGMTIGSVILAVTTTDNATGATPIWVSLVSSAIGLIYLLYHAVLSSALYANTRVRNEGYDVEELLTSAAGAA